MPFDAITTIKHFDQIEALKQELAVLEKARQNISKPSHWTKGQWYRKERWYMPYRACAVGHLALAAGIPQKKFQAQNGERDLNDWKVVDRICKNSGTSISNLATYNDEPHTSHRAVVAWYDQAIRRTQAQLLSLQVEEMSVGI